MSVAEFLQASVPFLAGLDEAQAGSLAAEAEQRDFSKGSTILFRGTTVDGLYAVAAGKVSVWIKPSQHKPPMQVAELGPGEVFGETSIIEMTTAGATIKASEDGTRVFVIRQESFREVLAQNPEFASRATSLIADRRKSSLDAAAVPAAA